MHITFFTEQFLYENPEIKEFIKGDFKVTEQELSKGYYFWVDPKNYPERFLLLEILAYENKLSGIPLPPNQNIYNLIKANNFRAIDLAIEGGHLTALKQLESYLTESEKKQIAVNYYCELMEDATCDNCHAILKHLGGRLTNYEKKEAMKSYFKVLICQEVMQHYNVSSHSHDINRLYDTTGIYHLRSYLNWGKTKPIQDIFKLYKLKNELYWRGWVANFNVELSEEEEHKASLFLYFKTLRKATSEGHLATIQYLQRLMTESEMRQILQIYDYIVIRESIINNQFDIFLQLLSSLDKEERKSAIKAHNFQGYRKALQRGYSSITHYIECHLEPGELREAVTAKKYYWTQKAALKGDLDLIKYLEVYMMPEDKLKAAKKDRFKAIENAIFNGHLKIILHLESYILSNEKYATKYNSKTSSDSPFNRFTYLAAIKGNLPILLHYLEGAFTKNEIKNYLAKNRYSFLQNVFDAKQFSIFWNLMAYFTLDEQLKIIVNKDPETLAKILSLIPAHETTISLNLVDDSGNISADRVRVLASLPETITDLELNVQNFDPAINTDLIQVFQAIPNSVVSLNLSSNRLHRKTPDALSQAFKAVPIPVTKLNLSSNGLWANVLFSSGKILGEIPAHISALNLANNQLHKLPIISIKLLKKALRFIETLYLSKREIKAMTREQRCALKQVLSHIPNIILLDSKGEILGGSDKQAQHYFASKYGVSTKPATLQSIAGFWVKHNTKPEVQQALSLSAKEIIKFF